MGQKQTPKQYPQGPPLPSRTITGGTNNAPGPTADPSTRVKQDRTERPKGAQSHPTPLLKQPTWLNYNHIWIAIWGNKGALVEYPVGTKTDKMPTQAYFCKAMPKGDSYAESLGK